MHRTCNITCTHNLTMCNYSIHQHKDSMTGFANICHLCANVNI